jgi:flagellar biosynthesis/type III secretory pathway chaperone
MAYDKVSTSYLDEERKKLWSELRDSQQRIQNLTTLIQSIRSEITEVASGIPEEVKSAKSNLGIITRYKNQLAISKDEISSILEKVKECEITCLNSAKLTIEKTQEINEKNEIASSQAAYIEQKYKHISSIDESFDNIDVTIERIETLESHSKEIITIKEKSNQALSNIQKQHKEVRELYNSIFGYTYTDEDTEEVHSVTGLKHELDKSYADLKKNIESTEKNVTEISISSKSRIEESIKNNNSEIAQNIANWQKEHDEILSTIRSLLPAALTAGLSVAFSEKKDAELAEQTILTNKFSTAIKYLSGISSLPVLVSLYFIYQSGLEKAISLLPQLASAVIPIYIPVLWLAYSLNKRLNLSKRLVEEYTHKEVLSKTFEGLSSQIDKIDNNEISKELRIKLLYNLLNVSSENPGKLISDYNKTDHPLLDVLEKSSKLTEAVESLSKIPGMGAISRFVENKADQLLATESKKVEDALAKIKPPVKLSEVPGETT